MTANLGGHPFKYYDASCKACTDHENATGLLWLAFGYQYFQYEARRR